MPAPTNISAATALELALSSTPTVQNVHDAGTTYTVWYKHTATVTRVVSLFAFGDLSVYTPIATVYLGPTGAPVEYLNLSTTNKPMWFLVEAGTTYYFECETNGGNPTPALLSISLIAAPVERYAHGDLFINTFNTVGDAFPGIIVSSTDGDDDHVKTFVWPMTDGENGDVLKTTGAILLESIAADCLTLYSPALLPVTTVAFAATSGFRQIRSSVDGTFWYVGRAGDGLIRTVLPDGSFGPTSWTVTATQVTGGIAANVANTILYHANLSANQPIKRYDLINNTPLSDLAAGVPNYESRRDIIVLEDDTILVTYTKTSVTQDAFVRRYSAAGATLNTYPLGTRVTTRLATALDSPVSFWVWSQSVTPVGFSTFQNIRTSDGVVLAEIDYSTYESGIYEPAATATPERFGPDFSCPFLILRQGNRDILPNFDTVEEMIVRERQSPHVNKERKRVTFHSFQLDAETGVGLRTGQGDDPLIELQISRDGGHTFGPVKVGRVHRMGQYAKRVVWRMLGQSRNTVFRVRQSDPVKTAWIGAYVEAEEDET